MLLPAGLQPPTSSVVRTDMALPLPTPTLPMVLCQFKAALKKADMGAKSKTAGRCPYTTPPKPHKLGLHISYMAPHRLDHRANWQLGRVTGQASLDWHQHRCVAVVSGATIKEMTAAGDDLADSNGWK